MGRRTSADTELSVDIRKQFQCSDREVFGDSGFDHFFDMTACQLEVFDGHSVLGHGISHVKMGRTAKHTKFATNRGANPRALEESIPRGLKPS